MLCSYYSTYLLRTQQNFYFVAFVLFDAWIMENGHCRASLSLCPIGCLSLLPKDTRNRSIIIGSTVRILLQLHISQIPVSAVYLSNFQIMQNNEQHTVFLLSIDHAHAVIAFRSTLRTCWNDSPLYKIHFLRVFQSNTDNATLLYIFWQYFAFRYAYYTPLFDP